MFFKIVGSPGLGAFGLLGKGIKVTSAQLLQCGAIFGSLGQDQGIVSFVVRIGAPPGQGNGWGCATAWLDSWLQGA